MIFCVWYPSGGFGHFINSILCLHGKNFKRPVAGTVEFSATGDSHALDLIAPKYYLDPVDYTFEFDPNYNYSVLIDNGINNETQRFKTFFPSAQTIKLCYNDVSWPVVAKTMIDKAMQSTVGDQLIVDSSKWHDPSQDWASREKYFLFLRDHDLRQAWKPNSLDNNLLIDDLLDYNQLTEKISCVPGIKLENYQSLWNHWYQHNEKYFNPVFRAQSIIQDVKNYVNTQLTDINTIWDQAVLYYLLWIEFGQEVPHNDYCDFFKDTNSIRKWLNL